MVVVQETQEQPLFGASDEPTTERQILNLRLVPAAPDVLDSGPCDAAERRAEDHQTSAGYDSG